LRDAQAPEMFVYLAEVRKWRNSPREACELPQRGCFLSGAQRKISRRGVFAPA